MGFSHTPFAVLFRPVDATTALEIEENVRGGMPDWSDWNQWEYNPDHSTLRAFGRAPFDDLASPEGELAQLSGLVWDVMAAYCDVYLCLYPGEPGERWHVADEEDYVDYQEMRKEMGLDPGEDI
jgi:hypothetical protein